MGSRKEDGGGGGGKTDGGGGQTDLLLLPGGSLHHFIMTAVHKTDSKGWAVESWVGWGQTPSTGLQHPSFNHCRI